MRTVCFNGQFIPESEAKLSIYDLSVMQAAAAFEMTRSFHGVHFKLREHLDRLYRSCDLLGIPYQRFGLNPHAHQDRLEDLCLEMARQNDHGPGEEHRLLLVMSPGCAPMYRALAGVMPRPFFYLADFPLRYTVAGFSRYVTEGVHGVTSAIQQVPDACVPSAAKHRSRLHFHLAQQQAPPGTWPILLDAHGTVTEAPGANLVVVSRGVVQGIRRQALPGISLATAMDLEQGVTDSAVDFGVSDLQHAEEVWLTGTPFCALPVVSLDGHPIGAGTPGPRYASLMQQWDALVGLDIRQQIRDWDARPPQC